MNNTIQATLSILGTILSIALFASPFRMMQSAYQSYLLALSQQSTSSSPTSAPKDDHGMKTIEIKSCFPYLSMFINCLFWVTYGVLSENFTLVFVNFIGFVFACYYNWLYFKITTNREAFLTKCSVTLFIYIIALGYVMFVVNDTTDVLRNLGFMAACCSILMFGSPLTSLKEVIEKRDASSIPLPVSIAAAGCSLTWTLYGLSMNDISIIVPNFIGSILGAIQLGLKFYYQKKRTVFSLLP
jgi:solute carrier family 50 protein (sugar transporter)